MEQLTTNAGWTGVVKKELTPAERDALLAKWLAKQLALKQAKEDEAKLRLEVIKEIIQAKPGEKGTRNFQLNNGYKLKAVLKLSYKLKKDEVDTVLDSIELIGEDGKFIAERLVKFDPELSVSEYNTLVERAKHSKTAAEQLAKINSILTIEDATPSLELVEPTVKK